LKISEGRLLGNPNGNELARELAGGSCIATLP